MSTAPKASGHGYKIYGYQKERIAVLSNQQTAHYHTLPETLSTSTVLNYKKHMILVHTYIK